MNSNDVISIFEREMSDLTGYAYNMLRNKSLKDDVVQKVYLYLTNKNPESFNDEEHVTKWLIWMTKICSMNIDSKESRFVQLEDTLIDTKKTYTHMPYEDHDLSNLNKIFREAVELLYPFEKRCVVLYYLEGKDRHEIAEILNTTPNTVNACIGSGIKALKKMFVNLQDFESNYKQTLLNKKQKRKKKQSK